MNRTEPSVGDPLPADCELIEIHVAELRQLFNALDASPFRDRDLDPDAEAFIVNWAREAPRAANLALLVKVSRGPGLPDEPAALRDAIHDFFAYRAETSRMRLRDFLRIGRISLLVGVVFLVAAVGLSDLVAKVIHGQRMGELLRQGLVIIGWVAMWHPLETFLYGWWPIRRQARRYDRLAAMPVRIGYQAGAAAESWRQDWPAIAPVRRPPQKPHPGVAARPGGDITSLGSSAGAGGGPIAAAVRESPTSRYQAQ